MKSTILLFCFSQVKYWMGASRVERGVGMVLIMLPGLIVQRKYTVTSL